MFIMFIQYMKHTFGKTYWSQCFNWCAACLFRNMSSKLDVKGCSSRRTCLLCSFSHGNVAVYISSIHTIFSVDMHRSQVKCSNPFFDYTQNLWLWRCISDPNCSYLIPPGSSHLTRRQHPWWKLDGTRPPYSPSVGVGGGMLTGTRPCAQHMSSLWQAAKVEILPSPWMGYNSTDLLMLI